MKLDTSRQKRKGQALIEASLILLVFLVVLIGIMDFGQFLYFHQSLSERARAGARYGAVHGTATAINTTQVANFALYNDPAGSGGGSSPLIPLVNDPTASADATFGTITASLLDAKTDDARVQVTISNYPFTFYSPVMSKIIWHRTVTATAPYEIGR